MQDLNTLLSGINYKTRTLVELYLLEKEKNKILNQEREELLIVVEIQKKEISDLIEKNKIVKLKNIITHSTNSTDIKLKINELVREVDRCIDLFTQTG